MHVVIVGGGFGGVKAALELSKRQIGTITLISDHAYFLHHASLYATATGRSNEESVIPLNVIFAKHPNVEIIEDHITAFDPHRKLVTGKKKDYSYDKLILALGSVTSFYNIKGVETHAFSIKTLENVIQFNDHIHDEVVNQKLDKEYFVIGAGLTGVEMASALNTYLKSLKDLYRLKYAQPRVVLIEAKSRILPHMSETASEKVHKQLRKQGIKVLLNHKVTALEGNTITVEGKLYSTTTAIWTSGLTNNSFYKMNGGYFNLTTDGRVNVNPYLEALDNVYVIGDNTSLQRSGMAWPALAQATHVAKNIARVATKRPQRAYKLRSVPIGVPVGEKWGYVEWHGVYVAGHTGSLVRRYMELYGFCQLLSLHDALPIWRAHDTHDVDDRF
ncbi:MAG: NAD(P)/FAD-dependent oxidoreductase [Candidatus Saccharimonadaceae bacterium]